MKQENYVNELLETLMRTSSKEVLRSIVTEMIAKRDYEWQSELEKKGLVRTAEEIYESLN